MPLRLLSAAALLAALLTLTACTAAPPAHHTRSAASTGSGASLPSAETPAPSPYAATPASPPVPPQAASRHAASEHSRQPRSPLPTPSTSHRPPPGLPVRGAIGNATQVITVAATSMSTTGASLQAWQRVGGEWTRVGPAVSAWLGSAGLTAHMSETTPSTPVGSFTLTQAFGREPDPGTRLPYFRTTPADWWISQVDSADYNTHQHCSSACPFRLGSPNERLYDATPDYDYAVVIDYNTSNAPGGVRRGAGSAIFLHVSVGRPTAGCVSIDRTDLVRIMRWLRPADHPRILIGLRR